MDEYVDLLCRIGGTEASRSLYDSLDPAELRQQIFAQQVAP
ncbi:MAG: hypothetical protein R2856_21310 [Caldilineaceae bacterium]